MSSEDANGDVVAARRALARECATAGIDAAHPTAVIRDAVRREGEALHIGDATFDLARYESVVVLGGGNAASQVAAALEAVLGDHLDGGVVVTDDPADTERVTVLRGDHPVPSERGVDATRSLLDEADGLTEHTLVLAVVTGGASALLPAPADGVSLEDLRATTDALLASGATIHELNSVRKHLSELKGGRLAARLAPARVATLLFSDVVGNDRSVIGSGPTVPDPTTYADALAVLEDYDVSVPDAVRKHLERGAAGQYDETPKEGDATFESVSTHLLADNRTAIDAAGDVAADAGYDPLVLSASVRGEAREAAKTHAAVAEEALAAGDPIEPPCVVLSGGECTVTVEGDGDGGPNLEFALSAALELPEESALCAVDTDGIDGATDAAGAVVDVTTVDDRREARRALRANDALPYLEECDALVETGATGTNVNDLRVLVIG
ncbi:glycerate kinase type-2 family protein [Halarchaeum sp. P4]|uniref:glycerate kinase type-2 family protein n=1 Tax=Halarchaeum sp. P4 TaxID=3421639 RepID=UPI003EC13A42